LLHIKQVEDDVLRQQIEQYNETVSRYQIYQQHQQQQQHLHLQQCQHEQQQQQEMLEVQTRQTAPADVVQALLDISTLPSSAVQLPASCTSHPGH